MPKEISYNKVFETLLSSHNNKMVQALKRRRLSGMLNVISQQKSKGMVTKGWRRLMTIRRALDSFTGFERTKMQKRFHHAFLQATAMHLFRDDVDVDLARVMKQNQWESLKQQCLCMTPKAVWEDHERRDVLCIVLVQRRELRDRYLLNRKACKSKAT